MRTLKTLLAVLAMASCSGLTAAEYAITSPNERLKVTLSTVDGDKTTYAVELNNGAGWRTLISPSEMAMAIRDGDTWGKNATVQSVVFDTVSETITPLIWKNASIADNYRQLSIRYAQDYSIVLRAYDDGVAYRFVSHKSGQVYVASETYNVRFAEPTKVWYPAMSNLDEEGTSENYERSYHLYSSIAAIDTSVRNEADRRWCATPALFGFDGGNGVKVALTEADLHRYPALYLMPDKTNNGMYGHWARYPETTTSGDIYDGPKVTSRGNYIALNKEPQAYPWRIAIVAEQDKDLLTNQLVFQLSTPQREDLDFSYVEPGYTTWEYYNNAILTEGNTRIWDGWNNISVEGNGFKIYKEFVDFAARWGFKYITIDTDGAHNLTNNDEKALVAYAKQLNVKIVKWTYIAYILASRNHPQELFNRGFAVIKVDFFYRADQKFNEEIEWLAETAAKAKVALLLHGCPLPHGLHRTYPNILSYEAVNGTENYHWAGRNETRLPDAEYQVELPFIRQLVGPFDYTPGSMRNIHKSEYQPEAGGAMGKVIPNSIGTRANEVAKYIMYDMPIAYLSDNPIEYNKHADIMRFLSKLPTTFDQSIALDGKVGRYAVMAKRKGNAWFVGGMVADTGRTLNVDFSFLPAGSYSARVFTDDPERTDRNAKVMLTEDITLTPADKLPIICTKEGGFVVHIFQKGTEDDPDVTTAVSKNAATADRDKVLVFSDLDKNTLTIRSQAGNIRAVRMVNLAGTEVAAKRYDGASPEATLSIASLPSALYLIVVETAQGTYSAKFLK
jgi:alpha-glucosidase